MISQNPLFRSVCIVTAFWYCGLFTISGLHGVPPWHVIYLFPVSILIAGAGLAAGAAMSVLAHSLERGITADVLHDGSLKWGAQVTLGTPAVTVTPARRRAPRELLDAQAWWPAVRDNAENYAAAIQAVLDTMYITPRMPASPYPGGHAGRTLIDHSLAVAGQMLVEAKKWEYAGQKDKRGRIRVPLSDVGKPHRFTGTDAPLLILTGLAHDIGKITCYVPTDTQPKKDGGVLRVTEVKRLHDHEGARLLRRIPEVMALPIGDRTALLVAAGYYHHPFGLPISNWLTDRMRSLTELLAHADIQVGLKEGGKSHPVGYGDYEDAENAAGDSAKPAQPEAQPIEDVDNQDTSDADSLQRLSSGEAASPPTHDASAPMELRLFMDAIRKPGAIGGKQRNARIAWKYQDRIYVMDSVMRTRLRNAGAGDLAWLTDATTEKTGNMTDYTRALAEQLHERNGLVTTFDGQNYSPSRALFWMKMKTAKLAVLIVPTSFIPGGESVDDNEPVTILGPVWGAGSAKNKAAIAAPENITVDGVEHENLSGRAAPAAEAASGTETRPVEPVSTPGQPETAVSDSDFPFDISEPEKPDIAQALLEVITSDDFRAKHSYKTKQRGDAAIALIAVDSDAGRAVGRAIDAMRSAGGDAAGVVIATDGDTGQRAYIFKQTSTPEARAN